MKRSLKSMPPNETRRLRFREMSTDDVDVMADLLGDARVMEYYAHPKDRGEVDGWIDWSLHNYAEYGHRLP